MIEVALEPCTASRRLSEVKHVPAAPGFETGDLTRDLSALFAEVVAQLGIEPMTKILLVVVVVLSVSH